MTTINLDYLLDDLNETISLYLDQIYPEASERIFVKTEDFIYVLLCSRKVIQSFVGEILNERTMIGIDGAISNIIRNSEYHGMRIGDPFITKNAIFDLFSINHTGSKLQDFFRK